MTLAATPQGPDQRLLDKLNREIGPDLRRFLADPTVTGIAYNSDQAVWVKRAGEEYEHEGYFPSTQAEQMMMTLAALKSEVITREDPSLTTVLPDGSRFEGQIPPIVLAPAFTIRKRAMHIYTLEDYVSQGVMTNGQMAVIKRMMDAKKNVLITGGIGTGKTTLVNAVIDYLAKAHRKDRLIVLEDTLEIQSTAPNTQFMQTATKFGFDALLHKTLRSDPARIILGEVRGPEAAQRLIEAWNTGNEGGLCTLHANTAADSLIRVETLLKEATVGTVSRGSIRAAVGGVVSLINTSQGRRVNEILSLNGLDAAGNYLTTTEE